MYVRGESQHHARACPHATFEDCTIVGPDNALQAGYPGVDDLCTRVKFKDCRLIVLNFSQPHGTPSSGIICCGCKEGKQLHVDFEDTVMMGYKVFGTRSGEVSYTDQGQSPGLRPVPAADARRIRAVGTMADRGVCADRPAADAGRTGSSRQMKTPRIEPMQFIAYVENPTGV